jgi:hypothetical protein
MRVRQLCQVGTASTSRPHAAVFRFYAELGDFLPGGAANREIVYGFSGSPSVKDAVEAQGIPHTEVDLLLANGTSVGFDYRLRDGDRIAAYPVFESFDITPLVRLRKTPLRVPRFVVDVNLGKLARWLRLLGFDAAYRNDLGDAAIVSLSVGEQRIVLTRDRLLLHHKAITHGYWVRSDDPEAQVTEVLRRFQLEHAIRPFTRCLECNGPIRPVAKSEILARVAPGTAARHQDYFECAGCGRIYWQGSHHARMVARIRRLHGH